MNGFTDILARWWTGGGVMMPALLAVSVVLYHLLGQRAWALYGPGSHRLATPLAPTLAPASSVAADPEAQAWAARAAAIAVEAELSRALGLIRALITALPLLGLLGTVTGMITTFAALGTVDMIGVRLAASGGIGMALTATQYGMALAIPAMAGEWVLRRRVACLLGGAAAGGDADRTVPNELPADRRSSGAAPLETAG